MAYFTETKALVVLSASALASKLQGHALESILATVGLSPNTTTGTLRTTTIETGWESSMFWDILLSTCSYSSGHSPMEDCFIDRESLTTRESITSSRLDHSIYDDDDDDEQRRQHWNSQERGTTYFSSPIQDHNTTRPLKNE
jgi:hypothetical protein